MTSYDHALMVYFVVHVALFLWTKAVKLDLHILIACLTVPFLMVLDIPLHLCFVTFIHYTTICLLFRDK